MADKDFVVKNGLVVNTNALVVDGANVGIKTATPDAALTVAGTANVQGNTVLGGNTLTVSSNTTFNGNVVINSNTFFNERIFIGNNQQFIPLARPVVQAVDNFNGFVQISSQNLANSTSGAENGGTDACSDMVIIGDDSYLGYDRFLDIGYNNSNFDGSLQYLEASTGADNLFIGSTVWQSNGVANVAVGVLKSRTTTNSTSRALVISVANGGSFSLTAGSNGALRDAAGNSSSITVLTHRNYPFTISKNNDGYLYVANGALSIGTSDGGRRANVSDPLYDASGNPLVFHTNGMLAENEVGRFVGNGNFVIGPNTTSRAAKLNVNGTANIAGQTNVGANVNVTGSVNATANVNAARGVFSTSVNVGIVALSSTQAAVGANVAVDAAGLKITGNSSIPSMNVSGGNITIGNASIANTPTVQLTNSTATSNLTPGGMQAGIVNISGTGTVNVGSNVWVTTSSIVLGNTTTNLVINTSASQYQLSLQGNAIVNGDVRITANLVVNGTTTYAGTTEAAGNFVPSANLTYDIGTSTKYWNSQYVKTLVSPSDGIVSVGNTTQNTATYFDSVRVSNSTSFTNTSLLGVSVGNSTVNGQYTSTATRIGNSTSNAVLNQTTLTIGNSSVNTTVNSSAFVGNVVATTISGNLTGNVVSTNISGNLTGNVAATTISGNLTGNVVAVTISGNLTGNVVATNISGNLTGNVLATNVLATTVNATTVNAATFTVGTAFRANSTAVTTANLSVIGNFQVTGTTTFVNTAVMDVSDINITLGKGAANPAAADGGGITLEGANASFNYSAASGNWVSNTGISVGNSTVNVTTNSSAFVGNTVGVHIGNVVATTVSGNLTGNVVATTISGNLTGNVSSTTTSASANVTVGANVLVNTSTIVVSNSTAVSLQTAGLMGVGNGSITSAPQILVQNTAGTTTINSNFISTTSISGNLTGNVSATTVGASNNINLGATVVANTSGVYASHLGGFGAVNYVKFSGSGDVSLDDGGTNASLTAVSGGVVYSNSTSLAVTAAGTAGQVLVSNASSPPVWTSQSVLTAGNSANLGGVAAASYQLRSDLNSNVAALGYQLNSTLASNVINLTSNNANFLGGTAAASYQLNSTLAANVATMTSNNSTYAFGKSENQLSVSSATNASQLGGIAASSYYRSGGTDVSVADGGTGASDKGNARINLGITVSTVAPSSPSVGDIWVDIN